MEVNVKLATKEANSKKIALMLMSKIHKPVVFCYLIDYETDAGYSVSEALGCINPQLREQ